MATEELSRHCYAIELSPPYVDAAVARWDAFTGKQATLEATSKTFMEIADGRGVSPALTPPAP